MRTQNVTGIKFRWLRNSGRYKVTQTNSNKSKYLSDIGSFAPIEYVETILAGCADVVRFSLIVDNTQNDYFLFAVDTQGSSFPDLLSHF
jgi:hypothetical protein